MLLSNFELETKILESNLLAVDIIQCERFSFLVLSMETHLM